MCICRYAFLFFLLAAGNSVAQVKVLEDNCIVADRAPAIRQTVIIIDGAAVVPDPPEGPSEANRDWRRFVSQFSDARNPAIDQLMGARERLTVAVANSDGSGLTMLFTGCIPLVSRDDADEQETKTTALERFFGNDWRSAQEKLAETFSRAVTLALVQGVKTANVGEVAKGPFAKSHLIVALNKTKSFNLTNGLPRLVFYTDFSKLELPITSISESRSMGRRDADSARLDLERSEVHIFSRNSSPSDSQMEYLKRSF